MSLEARNETVAGMVLDGLQQIPKVGDRFKAQGYTFEVVDMDGNRIDMLLVTPLDQDSEERPSASEVAIPASIVKVERGQEER